MAYELSFSGVFFSALNRAIRAIPQKQWDEWCKDEDCPVQDWMDADDVMCLAADVNTCDTIAANTPIGVYLDEAGYYMVDVMPLGHYLKHHPDICDEEDEMTVDYYEDHCWCSKCKEGPKFSYQHIEPPIWGV